MACLQISRPGHRLLVVEDDKAASGTICLMIARKFSAVTVYAAENGRIGLELFKEHTPDIVITDINMPDMDGIQMAGEIKSIKKDTKFIVITGYSDKKYLERFSEIGFSDYLLKPIAFTTLFAAIEKCIAEITRERQ